MDIEQPTVAAYAIAYLQDVDVNDEVVDYIRRIEATMAPYDGHFLVHGGRLAPLEGDWDGDVVVIAFPSPAAAQEWYDSPAYREILPLRTENSRSVAAIVEGLPAGYRATDKLAALVAGPGGGTAP